jgi:hypothetical protein
VLSRKNSLKNQPKANKPPKPPSAEEVFSLAKVPARQPAKREKLQKWEEPLNGYTPLHRHVHQKTRITVKVDVGFGNQLFIRGKGAHLTWEKGLPLINIKADEWTWETEEVLSQCEFKVLLNDQIYEKGENHLINSGAAVTVTPYF